MLSDREMSEIELCGICSKKICHSDHSYMKIDHLRNFSNRLQSELCWILKDSWLTGFQERQYFCPECILKIKNIISLKLQLLELIALSYSNQILLEEVTSWQALLQSVFSNPFPSSDDANINKSAYIHNKAYSNPGSSFMLDNSLDVGCSSDSPCNLSINVRDEQLCPVSEEKKCFKCTRCFKSFSSQVKLNKHEKIHLQKFKYMCSFCGKQVHRANELAKHERVHTGEKPYKCKICLKAFRLLKQLNTHKRKHTGEKDVCETCGRSFSNPDTYYRHKKTHFRKYNCDLCIFTSDNADHLEKHKAVHVKERRYPCMECDKSFLRSDHLTRHKRIHTGENPFQCKTCFKAFTQSQDLKRHEVTHSEEKKFICSICGKNFSLKQTLKQHEKVHDKKTYESDKKSVPTSSDKVSNYETIEPSLSFCHPFVSNVDENSKLDEMQATDLTNHMVISNEPMSLNLSMGQNMNINSNTFDIGITTLENRSFHNYSDAQNSVGFGNSSVLSDNDSFKNHSFNVGMNLTSSISYCDTLRHSQGSTICSHSSTLDVHDFTNINMEQNQAQNLTISSYMQNYSAQSSQVPSISCTSSNSFDQSNTLDNFSLTRTRTDLDENSTSTILDLSGVDSEVIASIIP